MDKNEYTQMVAESIAGVIELRKNAPFLVKEYAKTLYCCTEELFGKGEMSEYQYIKMCELISSVYRGKN